jgi:hypothetical protein
MAKPNPDNPSGSGAELSGAHPTVLRRRGTVKVDIPHRIYRVYGRQLAVEGADGGYSMAALFDYKGRLYQIEAKALPGRSASDTNFDLVRFQQSLTFTDAAQGWQEYTYPDYAFAVAFPGDPQVESTTHQVGGSNRSEDAIRAIREACRGLANAVNAAGNPVNPAGPDDPRCQVVAPE